MKDWLTIPEVCEALGISRATYQRFVQRGLLVPKKSVAPLCVFVPREQVEAIKAQSVSR